MTQKKELSLGYSSCPNDTFIFNALVHDLIDTKGLTFNVALEDVETLNKRARESFYDITKLSFAAYGLVREDYMLLESGAALGRGCGPLIISKGLYDLNDKNNPVIAVPGLGTTAYSLLQFYIYDIFKNLGVKVTPKIIAMPFEKIMPSVISGISDFGVVIHEARFVYGKMGLDMVCDLGQWWEEKTNLPIPLGCIAVKRALGEKLGRKIEALIRKSVKYGWENPDKGYEYIKENARELDDDVIKQHIALYVNEHSKNLGNAGKNAVKAFFNASEEAGFILKSKMPLFVS